VLMKINKSLHILALEFCASAP